ncbi:MAG: hypothetical protein MUF25_26400 [Pirellulaceae bacterium]|jgi:hypothetical protein|nr:hypothetical protein [Pirellulaceae bacterium]
MVDIGLVNHGWQYVWWQRDLGIHPAGFTAEVRPHGVVLLRLAPAPASETARTLGGTSRL